MFNVQYTQYHGNKVRMQITYRYYTYKVLLICFTQGIRPALG